MNTDRAETVFADGVRLSSRVRRSLEVREIITLRSLIRGYLGSHYWWLWMFVGLVSVYDAWLVVAFREIIHYTEQNPVGRLLIRLDSNGISYFLAAKAIGTALVLLALIVVHQLTHRYRHWIMAGVAGFQAWLLWYLSFAGTDAW